MFDGIIQVANAVGDHLRHGWWPVTLATGMLLLVAFGLDRLLERRVSAAVRLCLYGGVFARAALPGNWQSPLGFLRSGGTAASTVSSGEVLVGGELPLSSSSTVVTPGLVIALVWAVGVGLLWFRWWQARRSLAHDLRDVQPWQTEAHPPVFVHERIGPLVAGLWRPRVIVPRTLVQSVPPDDLSWVLRHEVAHVRRRDPLLGVALQLACILAWPVAPLWLAARRMRTLMELASDERALAGADRGARRRYGELLIRLAEEGGPGARLTPGMAFGSPLRARIRALAVRRRWPTALQAPLVVGVAALTLACAGAAEEGEVSSQEAKGDAVKGSLDKNAIRRTIRGHFHEVKSCYEAELSTQPSLGGRIELAFTITPTGSVTAATVASTTMNNARVEGCLVTAVGSWTFPAPEGEGVVVVRYPFTLTPRSARSEPVTGG